ncbi:hypothetical protein AOLI_G00185700 [Acnodon oligacanthus]
MDIFEETNRESMEKPVNESAEKKKNLQDLLREEMEMHIKEGRASVERNQERVERIKKLKEELHREEERQKEAIKESDGSANSSGSIPLKYINPYYLHIAISTDLCRLEEWSQAEYCKLLEHRRKLKEDHERVIQEELLKMERELQEEQLEGAEGQVMYLSRERQVLVLQMEALRRENQQAEAGLEALCRLHQQELHSLREESIQVFRTFRQVLEEQKRISEGRYRTLLLEAIQDAVHLSTQNLQLQSDNKQLRKALDELKALSAHTETKE